MSAFVLCLCISLSLSVCLSVPIALSVSLSLYFCLSLCPYISFCLFVPISLSVSLSLYLCLSLCLYISSCLSLSGSIYEIHNTINVLSFKLFRFLSNFVQYSYMTLSEYLSVSWSDCLFISFCFLAVFCVCLCSCSTSSFLSVSLSQVLYLRCWKSFLLIFPHHVLLYIVMTHMDKHWLIY